jgi:predicted HD superfamily hydrolase involved in NAD metabolism
MTLAFPTARADEFVAELRARLTDETLDHSLSSAKMMADLAGTAGIGEEQAVTTGLLHDLCKDLGDAELTEVATRKGVPISDAQRAKSALLHGAVAAEEVRERFGIQDEAVYDAIYWHSTGRPEFGPLGRVLYFADFAEPLRTHPEAEQARAILTSEGFSSALLFVSQRKLEYVRTQPVVDPVTEAFHTWLTAEFG